MDWFWHVLVLCFVIIPITLLWMACLWDILIRRRDLTWWKRLIYILLILVFPLIGALIYASIAFGEDRAVSEYQAATRQPASMAMPPGRV